jgi:hypothetical protein
MAGLQSNSAARASDRGVYVADARAPAIAEPTPSALPLFTKAIMDVPLPGAPPYVHQLGAEIGLAFVDGALRQNHVRRVSESLRLIDHGAALQTVRVDLSLSLLNEGQYRAGKAYSRLRGMNHGAPASGRPQSSGTLVWVPVTRLSRRSVSPVEVLEAHGNQVPRLTQDETGRLMAPAMYRLLRSILESDPDARNDESDLYRLLHWSDAARWVIQRALVALTTERANPETGSTLVSSSDSSSKTDRPPRVLAARVLEQKSALLDEYLRLLHVVINHYFVVVGLSEAEDEHTLTYRSPLEATGRHDEGLWELVRQGVRLIGNAGNAYDVEYQSRLSTGVRSYHFAAETELDLSIDPPYLTTDFDRDRTQRLGADLGFLSGALTRGHTNGRSKILDLELGAALGGLSEIVRRRQWEAEQVGLKMDPDAAPACQQLRDHTVSADRSDEERSIDTPAASPELLSAAAEELIDFELGTDLSAERDPPSSRAHAYWRKPLEGRASSLTTINVRCNFRITDSAEGGPRYAGLFVGAVALMNLLIALMLFGRLPFGAAVGLEWGDQPRASGEVSENADALVAVLLLVPGFLYTRLRLPVPGTIAGRLRTFTRVLSYTVILSSAAIGVLVAVGVSPRTLETAMWISIAIDLGCCGLLRLDRRERSPVPRPAWAHLHGRRPERARPVNVRFTGVGSPDDL